MIETPVDLRSHEFETLLCEVSENILTISLNRPDRLNAFTAEMMNDLVAAIDAADADDDVRAIIITGTGRAFCAGADLSAGAGTFNYAIQGEDDDSPVRGDGSVDYAHPLVRDTGGVVSLRLFRCLKPVIGAINGPAVGVGATMLLPMDMRVASTTARIGYVFGRRGIVNEAASAWFLPRIVGTPQALEWCMTGRIFNADEAKAGGLVRSIHEPDALMEAARNLARECVTGMAPVSVALMRQMLWRMPSEPHPMAAHQLDTRLLFARGGSGDAAEGVSSFLEKRPAVFPDRVSMDMPAGFPWWSEPEFS